MAEQSSSEVWVVHLGHGEWAELDELPSVILVSRSKLDSMPNPNNDLIDCEDLDHIHIKDLVEMSHWNDTCEDVQALTGTHRQTQTTNDAIKAHDCIDQMPGEVECGICGKERPPA